MWQQQHAALVAPAQRIIWQIRFIRVQDTSIATDKSTIIGCKQSLRSIDLLDVRQNNRLAAYCRYLNRGHIAARGAFGFRHIYMWRFVSSGIACNGETVEASCTSSNDSRRNSCVNPMLTTTSPEYPRGPQ